MNSAWRQQFLCHLSARVRADLWLYAAVFIYTAVSLILLLAMHQLQMMAHLLYIGPWLLAFFVVMPLFVVAFEVSRTLLRFERRRGLVLRRQVSPQRISALAGGLVLLSAMMIFEGSFTSIKNVLPILDGGFPDDRLHADIDRWLHFGHDPWQLLYAVARSSIVLRIVEFDYNVVWFALCLGGLFYVSTSIRTAHMRRRYVLMFMFVWIVLGNVLAGLSLSAGPAFYGLVTGDMQRFAEQTAFLSTSTGDNSASLYQAYLWHLHAANLAGLGSGISAFPSVHVGLAMMNALFLHEHSRRLGWIAFAYVGFVVLSSVYLGWHYAIDGYVAVAVVVLAHQAMRRLGRMQWNPLPIPGVHGAQLTGG